MYKSRKAAGVVAVVAALVVVTACSSGSQPPSGSQATASGNKASDETGSLGASGGNGIKLIDITPAPKSEVDSITWNSFAGEPPSLNPYFGSNYQPRLVLSNLCESLLQQQPDRQIKPNLATSVEYTDSKTLVIKLRDDVKFWDGTPMTVDDVVFSMTWNIEHPESFFHADYADVDSVNASGANEVTVKFKTPNYLFRDLLATSTGLVLEKKYFQEHEKEYGSPSVGVMCTGPYKFTSWSPGQSIVMTRNDSYWNPDLKPLVKKVNITFLTDDAAIVAALQSGEIDGLYELPYTTYGQLEKLTNGKVYAGPGMTNNTFFYVNPSGPMQNKYLREALQVAIPWDDILQSVFHGFGQVGRGPVPPSVFPPDRPDLLAAYNALPAPKNGDFDAAKKLVEQAGDAAKETIKIIVPATPSAQQMGQAVQAIGESIGLKIELVVEAGGAAFNSYLFDPEFQKKQNASMIRITEFPAVANPLAWFSETVVSGGVFNSWGYDKVDALYRQALETQDVKEQDKLMIQIMDMSRDDLLPMIPGLMMDTTMWMNNRLTGAPASQTYLYYPWAARIGGTA